MVEKKKFDVVGLGSCTLDLIFNIDDVMKLDMVDRDMVEKKYVAIEYSSKLNVKDFASHPGGSAANIACDLAQIGFTTAYIGAVGSDVAGKTCIEDMRKHGADVTKVRIIPEEFTAHSVILITPMGKDRSIMAYKGANDKFCKEHVDPELLKNTRSFAWTSLTSDCSIEAIKYCIQLTKNAGGLIAGAPSISIIKKRKKDAIDLIKMSDITSLNEEEITALTDQKDIIEAIKVLFGWGLKYVNVTFGKEGQWLACSETQRIVKTKPPVVHVNDTTGAGDATMSGIIYGILENKTMEETAHIAASLSAMEIESVGVRVGTPDSFAGLQRFMDAHPLEQTSIKIK